MVALMQSVSQSQSAEWILEIGGLGRIQEARIHLRPFTVLVGENNTGKSYVATLLWGMWALAPDPSAAELADPLFQACVQVVSAHLMRAQATPVTMPGKDYEQLLAWFNGVFARHASTLGRRLFNNEQVAIRRLALRAPTQQLKIICSTAEKESVDLPGPGCLHFTLTRALEQIAPIDQFLALWFAVLHLWLAIPPLVDGESQDFTALYLPASRSGFSLLYKEVVRRQIGRLASGEAGPRLPLPTVRFLEWLALQQEGKLGPFADIASYLEEPLRGVVTREPSEGRVAEYRYEPTGSGVKLPMALSSSLVTELTPVILALRHSPDLGALILEEPEAHLHPAMQRRLAVALARLVRRGVRVIVTTHSENFCQQLNNLVLLGEHPQRAALQEELGYEAQDYLRAEELGGYQFTAPVEQRTQVSELERAPGGLVMPSFNRELQSLVHETLRLQQGAADGLGEAGGS